VRRSERVSLVVRHALAACPCGNDINVQSLLDQ
jgi:hypothetical protein